MSTNKKTNDIHDSIITEEMSKMIRTERIENRFSQMELAERANCSRNTVYAIEKGSSSTKLTTCNRLAIALGYSDIYEMHEVHSSKPKVEINYSAKQKTISRIERYLSIFTNDELNSFHKLIESFAYSKMKSDDNLRKAFEAENNIKKFF